MSTDHVRVRVTVVMEFDEDTSTYSDRAPTAVVAEHQADATTDPAQYFDDWLRGQQAGVASVTVEEAGR